MLTTKISRINKSYNSIYELKMLIQIQTQTTLYFPNHVIMTQGNTCTYINDLTINNNSGDSILSSGF